MDAALAVGGSGVVDVSLQPREPPSVVIRPPESRRDDDRLQLRALERVLRDDNCGLLVADNAIDAMLQIGAVKPASS